MSGSCSTVASLLVPLLTTTSVPDEGLELESLVKYDFRSVPAEVD